MADALGRKLHYIYEVQISQAHPNIHEIIKEASIKDPEYTFLWQKTKKALLKGEESDFEINLDNILTFKKRTYLPNQKIY